MTPTSNSPDRERVRKFLRYPLATQLQVLRSRFRYHIVARWITDPWYRLLADTRFALRRVLRPRPARAGEHPVMVSLTSHSPRFRTLAYTLKTLMAQSVEPCRVVLWLSAGDYDALPDSVRQLQRAGLEVRIADPDLRSHNKLLPAVRAFPTAAIVIADDDVYYSRTWLESLVDAYRADSREVIGRGAHWIQRDPAGVPDLSSCWELVREAVSSPDIMLLGVCGVMYPPLALAAAAFDIDLIRATTPRNDDFWFHAMLRLNGWTSRTVAPMTSFHTWWGSQDVGLFRANLAGEDARSMERLVRALPGLV